MEQLFVSQEYQVPVLPELSASERDGIYVVGGSANPNLAKEIASAMRIDLGGIEQRTFPNSELYTRYSDSVRGKHVIIIQSLVASEGKSINDAIMELCLMADAARSSSAAEITAVCPSLAYTRQDRKSKGREPIGARVLIDQLTSVNIGRIVAVDMHSSQTQAIYRGPFDHLTAQPLLRQEVQKLTSMYNPEECMVVTPDVGSSKMNARHSRELGVRMLHLDKTRDPANSQKIIREKLAPEAEGMVCLMFDDEIDTAGTLVSGANLLHKSKAKAIYAAATHGAFSYPAIERLKDSPITKVVVTDTHVTQVPQAELGEKLKVVSIAPLIGRCLVAIIQDGSVSEIFNEQNYM